MEIATKEGKYIYCVIAANTPKTFGPLGIGSRGDELYTISYKDIAAVVSNSPTITYSISRENILTHEKAIEEAMKEHTVLPVRFGTIAEDEEKIKSILEKEYNIFKDLLSELEDKKELGLKAVLKKDAIYKDIIDKYEDIRLLKERIAIFSPEASHYQRMEIGKKVEDALQKEKEIYKKDILSTLSPLAVETKINNPYGEMMIISAAFLVEKHKEAEFDQKIQELDARYSDKMKFKYIGIIPPFNFVNLVIDTSTPLIKKED